MPEPLKLTIGAATIPLGKPSFVSKRDSYSFNIPTATAKALGCIMTYLERSKKVSGSLLDQLEQANRIYKKLKNMEIVQDLIKVVAVA